MIPAEIEHLIRARCKPRTWPEPLFSTVDQETIEQHFACSFPQVFWDFRNLLGKYWISGDHLPADELIMTYELEVKNNPNFTKDHIPFYAVGNGDYICFRKSRLPDSPIYYVAHDDPTESILHQTFEGYLKDSNWVD